MSWFFGDDPQCRNGHNACSECCATISQGCPSCSESTVDIPCLAMESVLKSLQVSCKHAPRGCSKRLKHFQIKVHEAKLCKYADGYLCPVSDCGHETPMVKMLDHITKIHGGWNFVAQNSPTPSVKFSAIMGKRWKRFMVITSTSKKKGSSLLVHFEGRESLGVLFFCTSIGDSRVFYNLKVKPHDGSASYVLETTAPFLQTKGESSCKRQFLLIPTAIDCDEARCKFEVELSFPENN